MGLGAFDVLLEAVRRKKVFQRNKIPLETKIQACLLHMAGLSYRGMTYQTGIIKASPPTVWYWVHKLGGLIFRTPRKRRSCVAVDETKEKLNGRQMFVWSAIDVDTKEMLAVYASRQRSSLNVIWFMRRVLATCVGRRKPKILVDGGPWYPWPLERMGFRWEHVTFGERNAIERLFRTLKERTGLFYDNINGRNAMANLVVFLDLFLMWYNHLRKHQGIDRTPTEAMLF